MTTTRPTGASGPPMGAAGNGGGGRGRNRGVVIAVGLVGSLFVAGGWWLPLWHARLLAPQYPGGLTMSAYGDRVAGDLNEINALNHYVGLGVFDPADVPEMRLWPFALIAALVAVVIGTLFRDRLIGRLGIVYLWTLPLGVLAAIQFRLHQFGQEVAPGAAFRIDEFTPWVVGRTTVWNFENWAWPGWGLIAILAAAAVVTVGPRVLRRFPRKGSDNTLGALALIGALALAGLAVPTVPAQAQSHDGHGQGAHEQQEVHDHGSQEADGEGGGRDPAVHGPPAPDVGPSSHAHMPTITEHPAAGDLRELLTATEPGGRLVLPPGTYAGPVVIEEPVILEGEDLPIIQGDGNGSVITVRAPGTIIRGLVVRGSGGGPTDNPAGIRIEADDVLVESVVVLDSYMGIAVDSSSDVKLIDNHIHGRAHASIVDEGHAVADDAEEVGAEGGHGEHAAHDGHADHGAPVGATPSSGSAARGDGVWLHDVDHVLVRGNHIEHARDGVYVSFGSGALLDSNHVHGSRYAVHSMFAHDLSVVQNHFGANRAGLVLMYGGDVLLLRNHIEGSMSASTGFAMILKDILNVEAVQNVIVDNRIGIHLDGPTDSTNDTTFTANTVARNAIGLQLQGAPQATFSGNSFADNVIQVVPLSNRLDDVGWAANGWGNYWSTYRGYDARGEGRGAVPHVEGGSVDRLLARNPELIAIADGPAMRLLRSVEERWGRRSPVLTDELPLTQPVSPALAVPTPEPAARNIGIALGIALVLPALALFVRPKRASASSRRSLRAAHV